VQNNGSSHDKDGIHSQQQVAATANRLNETEGYEGANKITMLPRFEIARRTVYESDGSPENTNALTIFCENENSELLKTLLVAADLDENEFGMFMLLTTRLSNPELQRDMYQKHLAFTQDLVAIAVEGLHLEVLEEAIHSGPAAAGPTSVKQILLQLERDGERPIGSIEYTTRSRDEGRFLFVTDREGAVHTERIIDNELMAIAGRTRAFLSHLHDNEKFADGIRRPARRMTRRELHETGVMARHGSRNGEERSRARQSRRQVVIIDAPWTLDDHPPLTQKREPASTPKPRNYAQAVIGQIPQQHPEQQHQQQSAPQQQPTNQGRSSPTNRSLTSDLGDDDTAATIQSLLTTVAEQQEQIQAMIDRNETFKTNVHKAVELRMQDQQARNKLALDLIEDQQKKSAAKHQQQMMDKDTHYQSEILAMMNQFNARDLAQPEAKRLADEQQLLRDEAIQSARVAKRSEHETTTARILLEMHQMMTAIAPSSITTQQHTTATTQRVTAPQSLPSRIFEMEMEDTSQLTNALSGPQFQDSTMKSEEDGVFSPPRISKKWPKSAPVESRSTEETQESTNESMEIGNAAFQEQEATIASRYNLPLFSGTAPYAEALANFAPQDHEQETHQDYLKTIEQTQEPQEQEATLHSEILPLFSGTASNGGALEIFLQQDKGQEEPQVSYKTIEHPTHELQEQDPAASVHLPLFSGTASHAEAMANFSPKDQGQDETQVSSKEIEQLLAKYQVADTVDNEDLPSSPGALTNAETTAKFLFQENWLDAPQVSMAGTGETTTDPQEQESNEATDDLPLFTGAAPNAEALANFLQEDQRQHTTRVELKETKQSTSEAQDQVDLLNTEDRTTRSKCGNTRGSSRKLCTNGPL
jgi:hypothetical protein